MIWRISIFFKSFQIFQKDSTGYYISYSIGNFGGYNFFLHNKFSFPCNSDGIRSMQKLRVKAFSQKPYSMPDLDANSVLYMFATCCFYLRWKYFFLVIWSIFSATCSTDSWMFRVKKLILESFEFSCNIRRC